MREILFRGQTRKYGEKVKMNGEKLPSNWVYGGVFAPNQNGKGFSIIYTYDIETNKYPVYADTIGQYTELKDKNGTKVFEGDIIKSINTGHIYEIVSDVISFKRKSEEELYTLNLIFSDIFEVIGNIHDNPELLEFEKR